MQEPFTYAEGENQDKRSDDPRDNPIEQTSTPTDPNVDPATVTNTATKPPYYGEPQGGGEGESDQ